MSDRHCDEDLKRAVCTMTCYIKDRYFLSFNTRSDIKSQNRYILDIRIIFSLNRRFIKFE